jgi:hypothetical protein
LFGGKIGAADGTLDAFNTHVGAINHVGHDGEILA